MKVSGYCRGAILAAIVMQVVAAGGVNASSDLVMSITDSEDPTRVNHTFSYFLSVSNAGPDAVTNAEVTDVLADETAFATCNVSQGTWTEELGVVSCELGLMEAGATALVEIVVQATTVGVATNRATLNGDTETANNRQSETTTINPANRAPTIDLPGPHTLAVGGCTGFVVTASDPDHDPVTLSCTEKPQGATFDGTNFSWCAGEDDCGTTNWLTFVADDQQGETNSVVTNRTYILVPVDHDGDTLSDAWEWHNFGCYSWGAGDDPDGDGIPNYDEYVAGTEPTNAESRFHPVAVSLRGESNLVVRWQSVAGRYYAVSRSTNWPPVGGMSMIASNIAATPPENVYTDTVAGAWEHYYYRLYVRTNQW